MRTVPTRDALPASVAWLGYGGLLPFVALAAAAVHAGAYAPAAQRALLAYGAVILSFVGALHWGFATVSRQLPAGQRNAAFAWSVVPALVAWPALLVPAWVGALLLVAGFVAHLAQDWRLAAHAQLPGWYLPMRLRLTLVASLSLLAGAWAARAAAIPAA